MPQFGRPSADTTIGTYTDQAAGAVNIYLTIDEVTASDADFIRSVLAPSAAVYVTALSSIEDPVSSAGHIVRWRRGKDAAGGATIQLTVQLRQGYVSEATPGTLIATPASAETVPDAFTTATYTLVAAEADAITAYGSLFLRFSATQV